MPLILQAAPTNRTEVERVAQQLLKRADRGERRMKESVAALLRAATGSVTVDLLDRGIRDSDFTLIRDAIPSLKPAPRARLVKEMSPDDALEGLVENMASIANDSSQFAASFIPSFDLVDTNAVEFAYQHAGRWITHLDATALQSARDAVGWGIQNGRTVEQTSRYLRSSLYLPPRYKKALTNYEAELLKRMDKGASLKEAALAASKQRGLAPATGLANKTVDELVAKYGERLLANTAEGVARTMTIEASNAGLRDGWEQAAKAGMFDAATAKVVWYATNDDRVCPQCMLLDGQTVAFVDGKFEVGEGSVPYPPAHVSCRCTTVLVTEGVPQAPAPVITAPKPQDVGHLNDMNSVLLPDPSDEFLASLKEPLPDAITSEPVTFEGNVVNDVTGKVMSPQEYAEKVAQENDEFWKNLQGLLDEQAEAELKQQALAEYQAQLAEAEAKAAAKKEAARLRRREARLRREARKRGEQPAPTARPGELPPQHAPLWKQELYDAARAKKPYGKPDAKPGIRGHINKMVKDRKRIFEKPDGLGARQSKREVARTVAERLDVPTEDLIKIIPSDSTVSDVVSTLADARKAGKADEVVLFESEDSTLRILARRDFTSQEWEILRRAGNGELPEIRYGSTDPLNAILRGHSIYGARSMAFGNSNLAAEMQRRQIVSRVVQRWAVTSNNADIYALTMQHAIADEFGLNTTWNALGVHAGRYASLADVDKAADALYREVGETMRKFARAMYDNVQAELRRLGYKDGDTVAAIRGWSHSYGREPAAWAGRVDDPNLVVAEPAVMDVRPASSWSVMSKIANNFEGGTQGFLSYAEVPIERIIGMPGSGFGCLDERELVVLGDKAEALLYRSGSDWQLQLRNIANRRF